MDQAEDQGRLAEAAIDAAEKHLETLEADAAEKKLEEARERLADPGITKYPEHSLLKDRVAKGDKRLIEVRQEIERRELEKKVALQRGKLEASKTRFEKAMEALKKPGATGDDVDRAKEASDDVSETLSAGTELESKDAPLEKLATNLRKLQEKGRTDTERIIKLIRFKEGPLVQRVAAAQLIAQTKGEKDKEKVRELNEDAVEKYRACFVEGKEIVASAPELVKSRVDLEGKSASIEAVLSGCQRQMDALVKRLAVKPKPPPAPAAKPKAKPKKK